MPGPIHGFPPLPMPNAVSPLSAKTSPAGVRKEQLEKACQDFEALFIHQMMEQMRRTIPEDGLFSGGRAEQMYTSMLDSEVAQSVARDRGMGLASVLYRQLVSQIEPDGSEEK